MDLIDSKYISLVSARLQKFKRVKSDLYNFRCPICGDSQRNKNKARGYLYAVKANTNFKCHNCGASMSFNNLLKKLDSSLHGRYTLEKYKTGVTGKNFVVEEPEFVFEKPKFAQKINLPLCSEVEVARSYLEQRKIDPSKFYFAENFDEFVKSFPDVDYSYMGKESRIIIPLFYEKSLVGFQGRAIGPNKIKYITVMLNDKAPKIYGLDTVRGDAPVYVTEGPFIAHSFHIRLLCAGLTLMLVVGGLAILSISTITNRATEKLSTESVVQSIKATPSYLNIRYQRKRYQ